MTLLTPREEKIAKLVSEHFTAKEIALELGIGYSTVRSYIEAIARKVTGGRGKPMRRIALWYSERKAKARRANESEHPVLKRRREGQP